MDEIRHWRTRVVGGTSRQSVIQQCRIGEPLRLDVEPDNAYDPGVVVVRRYDSEHSELGCLHSHVAAEVQQKARRGYHFSAFVSDVTSGTDSDPSVELHLLVVQHAPNASKETLAQYVSTHASNIADALRQPRVTVFIPKDTGAIDDSTRLRKPAAFWLIVTVAAGLVALALYVE